MKTKIIQERAIYSEGIILKLSEEINRVMYNELNIFNLTIVAIGDFGRLEASKYSLLQLLFIIDNKNYSDVKILNFDQIKLFSKIIAIAELFGLKLDENYLKIIYNQELIDNIGSNSDDQKGIFAPRMYLLLESYVICNQLVYEKVKHDTLIAYDPNYNVNSEAFESCFLINDIMRFWLTSVLKYELNRKYSKRHTNLIQNYKLKLNGAMSAAASIKAILSCSLPTQIAVIESIISMTPIDRLIMLESKLPTETKIIKEMVLQYTNFLLNVGTCDESLKEIFSDKDKREKLAVEANNFGKIIKIFYSEFGNIKNIQIGDFIL